MRWVFGSRPTKGIRAEAWKMHVLIGQYVIMSQFA